MTVTLVTGANGFIGQALCSFLVEAQVSVRGIIRFGRPEIPGVEYYTGAFDDLKLLERSLIDVDCVIHLAGRAHKVKDKVQNPLDAFRAINVHATLALAKASLEAGVKRFVFISSIGVNGSQTIKGGFNEESTPAPHADYAVSKFEAEQALRILLSGSEMELVIIRPPLVYAGNAPGNFKRLLKLVKTGVPLPFADVKNQRSMIALENLVSFIKHCAFHPKAANELFLISDGGGQSLPNILTLLARGLECKSNLIHFPVEVIKIVSKLTGQYSSFIQLCGSLEIDSSKGRILLGWSPPIDAESALVRAGRDFRIMSQKTHL